MKNKIEITESGIKKIFTDEGRFNKEVSLLNFLATSPLKAMVSKVLETNQIGDSWVMRKTAIDGRSMTAYDLSVKTAKQLGDFLGQVHSLGMFASYGSFDSNFAVVDPCNSFFEFALTKAEKWYKILASFSDNYKELCRDIFQSIKKNKKELDEMKPALFCHNDFDFKNIIIKQDDIVGIIDWEFAGAYPLAWELRKMALILFWSEPKYMDIFKQSYQKRLDKIIFPGDDIMVLLVAIDCIGALGWSFRQEDHERTEYLNDLIRKSVLSL